MIETVPETGSTNSDLLARLKSGEAIPEGHWLVADKQTAGRGRQKRNWFDGAGNFMGSTVVHLHKSDPGAQTLALVAGLALYEAVRPLVPPADALILKWPNDLLLNEAKVSGILMERANDTIVLGIGVNLAQAPDLPDRPTIALAKVTRTPDRDTFADALASSLAEELQRWRSYGVDPIRRRWLAVAHPEGTPLRVHDADGTLLEGAFAGLGEEGALLLRLEDGAMRAIHAADVMLA